MLWGLGLGTLFILGLWLVVADAYFRRGLDDTLPASDIIPAPVGEIHEYPEGLSEAHGKVTTFLKAYIVFFVLWTIGYVYIFMTAQK